MFCKMVLYRKRYKSIVVGAWHAGCEAALSAARMGCSVLVLVIDLDKVATMPCNSGKAQSLSALHF